MHQILTPLFGCGDDEEDRVPTALAPTLQVSSGLSGLLNHDTNVLFSQKNKEQEEITQMVRVWTTNYSKSLWQVV